MPLFVKNFIIDFVETFIGAVFAMNLAIPGDLNQAKALAMVLGAAAISALVSAARRAAPAALAALRNALGVPPSQE